MLLAAEVLDFFSTTLTGVGTGSDFAGADAAVETEAGTTAKLFGWSVLAGAGFAAGSESEGADFGVEGSGTWDS